ncbi:MAG: DUF1302 domain-containing protein [Pseudomonadota bacterium]|nr:DUF1302 domain-containing protein [Pseudomonadota bacterium]
MQNSHVSAVRLQWGMWTAMIALLASAPVQAIDFDYNDIIGTLNTRVTLGASWRVEDRNNQFIDKNNLNPSLCGTGIDTACVSFNGNPEPNQKLIDAPGAFFGVNKDDGNMNYDPGDVVAAVSKISSELTATWGDFTFRASGTYFFDPVNDDFDDRHFDPTYQPARTPRSDEARGVIGSDATLENLLVSGLFNFFDHDFALAVGYQQIRWGESTLIALNSLSEINPPDARYLYQPGTQIAAVFQTTPAVVLSTSLTDDVTVDLFYQLGWRGVEVPPGGSFFSTLDVIGRDTALLTVGQFHEDPERRQRLPGIGVNISDTSLTVALDEHGGEPRDDGQVGAKLTAYFQDIGTELSLYTLNYHSRLPYLSMYASDHTCIADTTTDVLQATTDCRGMKLNPNGLEPTPIDTARIFLDYPEDIQLYGVSFNTTIGKWSLAGEAAYRPNVPVQIHIPDVVFAGIQPALPANDIVLGLATISDLSVQSLVNAGLDPATALAIATSPETIDLALQLAAHATTDFALPSRRHAAPSFLTEYRNMGTVEANELILGYERLQVLQMGFTGIRIFGSSENPIGADQVQLLIEAGFTWAMDMPSRDELQFEGGDYNNTHASGGADGTGGLPTDGSPVTMRLTPTQQTEGFADEFAAGYRMILRMEYNQWLFGWTYKPQIVWSHDVEGISISPAQNFIEGTMMFQLATDIEITNRLTTQLYYQGWADGGTVNGMRDRDYAGFAVAYTF